jgi:hypothetical protein
MSTNLRTSLATLRGRNCKILRPQYEIRQRVSVERFHEGVESFIQDIGKPTTLCNDALVVGAKALNKSKVGLRYPNDITKPNVFRSLSKHEPARSTSDAMQIARPRQHVGDLHHVPARYLVDLRSLLDRNEALAGRRGIHEQT